MKTAVSICCVVSSPGMCRKVCVTCNDHQCKDVGNTVQFVPSAVRITCYLWLTSQEDFFFKTSALCGHSQDVYCE
jgi:hypothetical protein